MKRGLITLSIVAVAILLPLTYFTLSKPAVTSVEAKPTASKYEVGPPDAAELLELVNKEREKVGVSPLEINGNVAKSAQLKASDFSKRDYYSHTVKGTNKVLSPEMDKLLSSECTDSSENIAGDQKNSWTTVYASDGFGWMSSESHKEAMLDPNYTETGFGISQEKDGDYFVVQHFCIAK